jgi:acyl-CoA reductase-like NAD-dependent aldehyde dehydrogenase
VAASGEQKRVVLELRGRGTAVVLQDADEQALDAAVLAAGLAFTPQGGQAGTAPARMLVHRSLYDKAVEALTAYAESAGVSPLISESLRDRVEAYVEDARREGAQVTIGGERPEIKPGLYATPTVLADVSSEMTCAQAEVAGPVVAVIPFDDEAEAVHFVTRIPAALRDHVFSADTAHAWRFAAELRSGSVGINTAQQHPETPVASDGGPFGLFGYCDAQTVAWTA